MTLARNIALLLVAGLLLAACGGGDSDSPEDPDTSEAAAAEGDPDEVQVIREWSEALTEGDIDAAADYFAVPSTAENGFPLDIENKDDARLSTSPCPVGRSWRAPRRMET